MKGKKLRIILCTVLILAAAAGISAYAAYHYGTENDSLITKSYLDQVLMPELINQFSAELEAVSGGTTEKGTFEVVTLSNGQTLTGQVGCEVMLRIGSAYASGPDSPVLVDTTSGSTLENGGTLTKNHLYMVTIVSNGLTASSDGTKVLVSGSYTIG